MENFEIQWRFKLLMTELEYLSYNNYEFIRSSYRFWQIKHKKKKYFHK